MTSITSEAVSSFLPCRSAADFQISESDAPLGYEPEGQSDEDSVKSFSKKSSGSSTPNYVYWSQGLHILLKDEQGLNLFRSYLKQINEANYCKLEFWLACKGLSKQQPHQIHQSVKVIFLHLFLKAQFEDSIRDPVIREINYASINNKSLSVTVFDVACQFVEKIMNNELFPEFLNSQVYLDYVEEMRENGNKSLNKEECSDQEIISDIRQSKDDELMDNRNNKHKTCNCDHRKQETFHKLNPEVLIKKLENMKQSQILENTLISSENKNKKTSMNFMSELASILSEKVEENSEAILDGHISNVWPDHTMPKEFPVVESHAQTHYSDGKNRLNNFNFSKIINQADDISTTYIPHPYASTGPIIGQNDKDLYSSDSGVGTISSKGTDYRGLSKNKMLGEHSNSPQWLENTFSGYFQRGSKLLCSSRRTTTDSGMSDMSFGYSDSGAPQRSSQKERITTSYIPENKRVSEMTKKNVINYGINQYEIENSNTYKYKPKSNSVAVHNHNHKNKNVISDKNIIMAPVCPKNVMSNQSSIADPSMPPDEYQRICYENLEAQRRYLQNKITQKYKYYLNREENGSACCSMVISKTDAVSQKFGAKSNKSNKINDDSSYTTVIYNYNDEEMPYLLKLPGNVITLRQFKESLPKKGYYRYFFVTTCEDLKMGPIQEEITDDNQYLPFWKGKVNAQIKLVK